VVAKREEDGRTFWTLRDDAASHDLGTPLGLDDVFLALTLYRLP
jgi:hypothetical protein